MRYSCIDAEHLPEFRSAISAFVLRKPVLHLLQNSRGQWFVDMLGNQLPDVLRMLDASRLVFPSIKAIDFLEEFGGELLRPSPKIWCEILRDNPQHILFRLVRTIPGCIINEGDNTSSGETAHERITRGNDVLVLPHGR